MRRKSGRDSIKKRIKEADDQARERIQKYPLWFANANIDNLKTKDLEIQLFYNNIISHFRIGGASKTRIRSKKEIKQAQKEFRYYFEKILVKKGTPTEKEIEFINAKRQSVSRCIELQPYRKRGRVRYIPRDYPYISNDDLAFCYDMLVHAWIDAQAIKKCRECNQFFKPNKYNLRTHVFCGEECKLKGQRRRHRKKYLIKHRKEQREYMRKKRKRKRKRKS